MGSNPTPAAKRATSPPKNGGSCDNSAAEVHGKPVGQIALRWNIQRGIVVIPKSVRKERIAENFDVFDFELTENDTAAIAELDEEKGLSVNHDDPESVKALYARDRG